MQGRRGGEPQYKEQYDFRKAIAEYWINPELITSEKESNKRKFEIEIPSPSTLSALSLLSPGTATCTTIATESSSNQRSSRVDTASLEPTGRLSLRLNRSVDHIPDESKNKARCCLHWWAANVRLEGQILACLSCNVTLCTKCFGLFHRVQDLNAMKERIKNDVP